MNKNSYLEPCVDQVTGNETSYIEKYCNCPPSCSEEVYAFQMNLLQVQYIISVYFVLLWVPVYYTIATVLVEKFSKQEIFEVTSNNDPFSVY